MKTVICIGDSNTYGYTMDPSRANRYPEEIRWTGLLEKAGYRVINNGINGRIIPVGKVAERAAEILDRYDGDFVTVMLGTNDTAQGISAEECGERMDHLIRCLREKNNDIPILLIAPVPMKYGDFGISSEGIRESAYLGRVYKKTAEDRNILFADAGEWNAPLTRDGVHLSEEGHRVFAEKILEIISKA